MRRSTMKRGSISSEDTQSQMIDLLLDEEKARARSHTLVLMGGPDSGKIQILIQATIAFGNESDLIERVHASAVEALKKIVQNHSSTNGPLTPETQELAQRIIGCAVRQRIDPELSDVMSRVWGDASIQSSVDMWDPSPRIAAYKYLLDHVTDLGNSQYHPSPLDLMHCAAVSQCVNELIWNVQSNSVRLVDVGAQRGERRKWLHHFSTAKIVAFVVDLTAHTKQTETNNNMSDTIEIYKSVVTEPELQSVPLALLFTNAKEFRESFASNVDSFSNAFPTYTGEPDAETAIQHLTKVFEDASVNKRSSVGAQRRAVTFHFVDPNDKTSVCEVVTNLTTSVTKS